MLPDTFNDFLANYLTDNKRHLFEKVANERTRHIAIALENVFQPQNASAAIRSCDCFGIQDVYIIENSNTYEINPNVVMGANKWVDIHKFNDTPNNTLNCITHLKKKGYRIVATTPHTNDYLIDDLPLDQPIALFFGTEKFGLSKEMMEQADDFVRIPMYGFTESFNISVSVSLCLQTLAKRIRSTTQLNWRLTQKEQSELKHEWTKRHLNNWPLYLKEYTKLKESLNK
jgi:tRNA (guanosine-2'-O-)-methyltransferase